MTHRIAGDRTARRREDFGMNLFVHPLSTPAWEQERAAPLRLATRALWTTPDEREPDAPRRRIIHQRAVFGDHPMDLDRLEVVDGHGYHKCASGQERDRPVDVTVYAMATDGWRLVDRTQGDPVDLGQIDTTALLAQVRSCTTDRYWAGWNVTNTGLVLHGSAGGPAEVLPAVPLGAEADVDLGASSPGVTARHLAGEVRYRTDFLEVGFRLHSAAFSFLSVDEDGTGRHARSLLQLPRSMDIVRSGVYPSGVYPVLRDLNAAYLAQGPRLAGSDGRRSAGFLAALHTLRCTVRGSTVEYHVDMPRHRASYRYAFHVERARLTVQIERTAEHAVLAWDSSAWHVATDNRVTPTTVLGRLTRVGETGLVEANALWHFPRHGCLHVRSTDDVTLRSDSCTSSRHQHLRAKSGRTGHRPRRLRATQRHPSSDRHIHRGGAANRVTVGGDARAGAADGGSPHRHSALVPTRHVDNLQQRRIDALHDVVERRVGDRRTTRSAAVRRAPNGTGSRLPRALATRRTLLRQRADITRRPPARRRVRPSRGRHPARTCALPAVGR